MRFILRVLVNAIALYVADYFIDGIALRGMTSILIAGLVLGVVNAIIRPVLLILTFPFTLLTLGLFIFVVNAICLGLTAFLVPGFSIAGFWPAFGGALIVTLVSWALNALTKEERREKPRALRQGR